MAVRITDYLTPDRIWVDVAVHRYEDLCGVLLDRLVAQKAIKVPGQALDAILERARQNRLVLGQGVSIPHALGPFVHDLIVALVKLPEPLDLDTPDQVPVWLVVLVLAPRTTSRTYLRLLAHLARMLSRGDYLKRMRAATEPAELYQILRQADEELE